MNKDYKFELTYDVYAGLWHLSCFTRVNGKWQMQGGIMEYCFHGDAIDRINDVIKSNA